MIIEFSRGSKCKKYHDHFSKAIYFFLKELKIPVKELERIFINVSIKNTGFGDFDVVGQVWNPFEDPIEDGIINIKLDIRQRYHVKKMLSTIAHECVHIKQYVMGELKDNKVTTSWKGKRYKDDLDPKYLAYEVPWEKEAYSKQDLLVEKFLSSG